MKWILYKRLIPPTILGMGMLFLLLGACNGENAPDCFKNSGPLVREELLLEEFDKITVNELVRVVIQYGTTQRVEVETGQYLRPQVTATVTDGRLDLRNTNNCNLFRDYGLTTFYVTVPNLSEIRSNTGYAIESDGALPFESLTLYSESFINPETETTDGSFDLHLDVQSLNVVVNGIAYFRLTGSATNSNFTVAAGDSRIEAETLIAQRVTINHRGSNDILVHPEQLLQGVIRGTGDVISFNRPDTVSMEILYKGRLLYRD